VVRKKYLSWIWASRYSRRSSSSIALQKVRVCIVGAGPAGFYTAKYLMKELSNVQVHILDALPTPYGTYFEAE
jgi:ribulose 1,5-bisphosphate synthetase/thiazole synthase